MSGASAILDYLEAGELVKASESLREHVEGASTRNPRRGPPSARDQAPQQLVNARPAHDRASKLAPASIVVYSSIMQSADPSSLEKRTTRKVLWRIMPLISRYMSFHTSTARTSAMPPCR